MNIQYCKDFADINHCNTTREVDTIIMLTNMEKSKSLGTCSNIHTK